MTSPPCNTLHVPLRSNTPPYRIYDAADGDCCLRIHWHESDLLVLVPPGDSASEFRSRLIGELQAFSVRGIVTRRYDRLLTVLLLAVIPGLLIGLAGVAGAGLFGFLDGSVLEHTAPFTALALLAGYALVMLAPRVGVASMLMTATYPADPVDAMRNLPSPTFRYLVADELTGGPAMEALRRTILHTPTQIRPEERSALWVLAARDDVYPSALATIRRLAQQRYEESLRSCAWEFAVEMQVVRDELENASGMAPPTSAW